MTPLIPVTGLMDQHPLIEANPGSQVVMDHMADCPVMSRGSSNCCSRWLAIQMYS